MTTFDSWEVVIRPPEDYLMHHGIRGMKHGRNRYQNPDGTWTEEGLERRRQREGFGESRKEQRLAKKVAKAEKKEAKKAARVEAKAAVAERRRTRSLKGLTDDELKAKLARAEMESKYRELTKKGTALESGLKLVKKYLDYQDNKQQRALEFNKQKLEFERLKTQQIQANKNAEKAHYERKKARSDARKARFDSRTARYNNKQARAKSSKFKEKKNYIVAKRSYKMAKKNHWKASNNNQNNGSST